MKGFNPVWIGLLIIAALAILGVSGKLDSRMQDCIESGGVWVAGQGSRCHDRNPEVEQSIFLGDPE